MRFERLWYTSFVLYNANERVQVPVRVVSIHRVAVWLGPAPAGTGRPAHPPDRPAGYSQPQGKI